MEAIARAMDAAGVSMTQVLVPSQDVEIIALLNDAGFHHLADLLYLTCEASRFPTQFPASDLQFVPYDVTQRGRLMHLVERTYEGGLDCAGLNGVRRMEDVIDGYQQTGAFRPENWLIVQRDDQDVGVLLLTDHPGPRHWELVYMGLVPAARGRGWGRQIARHAQWLANGAQVERIVLAVDAENWPALEMYRVVGFEPWDRRTVYVRIAR
jgi:ribosomal protein S18 acetylase RimI-like enzyme